jgi:hypothetical protein
MRNLASVACVACVVDGVPVSSVSALTGFAPCVGCGYCCLARVCSTGIIVATDANMLLLARGQPWLDLPRRCPCLVWAGNRYRCSYAGCEGHSQAVGIGEGCSSSMNSWRQDVRYRG